MAHYLLTFKMSFRPFVCSSALIAATLLGSGSLSAKPKSPCAQQLNQESCAALKAGTFGLCQWVDMSGSYTVNGQRKSYCRTSGKSLSKEQFEALQAAQQAGSSGQAANAR